MPHSLRVCLETCLPCTPAHGCGTLCPLCRVPGSSASTLSPQSQGPLNLTGALSVTPMDAPLLLTSDGAALYSFPITFSSAGHFNAAGACYSLANPGFENVQYLDSAVKPPSAQRSNAPRRRVHHAEKSTAAHAADTPVVPVHASDIGDMEESEQSPILPVARQPLPAHIVLSFRKLTLRLWLPCTAAPGSDSSQRDALLLQNLAQALSTRLQETPSSVGGDDSAQAKRGSHSQSGNTQSTADEQTIFESRVAGVTLSEHFTARDALVELTERVGGWGMLPVALGGAGHRVDGDAVAGAYVAAVAGLRERGRACEMALAEFKEGDERYAGERYHGLHDPVVESDWVRYETFCGVNEGEGGDADGSKGVEASVVADGYGMEIDESDSGSGRGYGSNCDERAR